MTELLRAVSRRQLVGLAINDVVGSGVFLLPAAAVVLLGPNSVFAILLAGGAVALLVLCFAAAASYFDEPGGAYVYTREAFGPFVGFEVGFMTWLARIASIASLANGFALAVAYFWPAAESGAPRALIVVALLGLFCWINVVGVQHGARTAVVLVIAKLLPLALFKPPCQWRNAAIDALTGAGRKYRVLYQSANSTAISAAVLAGLAVTVLAESALRPGMRVLGEGDGFPRLPTCEIGLIRSWSRPASATVDKLAEHITSSLGNLSVPAVASE